MCEVQNTGHYEEYDKAIEEEGRDLAGRLLYLMEATSFGKNFKYPWMAKVITLSLEYLTLDDLSDALHGSQIPDEILDICGEQLKEE